MDEPDAVLAARGRDGDRTALGLLIRRHQGVAFGVAYRLLGSREDAEDIAQEAFVQVLTRLHTLQDPAAFVGWLRRVTVNLCLDRQRRGARVLFESLEPDLALPDPGCGSEALALTAERWREVERELAALPTPYRLAVVLRDVEGLAYQEVASLLGVPEGTVKSRLHEGRRLLRRRLPPRSRDGASPEEAHHAQT